ncbi:MAG: hypothetical protein NTX72_06250 [Candidatus Uhrbacteria bacterium]|nr:hypothetical protein [Candidatus Uhrbacteria bacterium]
MFKDRTVRTQEGFHFEGTVHQRDERTFSIQDAFDHLHYLLAWHTCVVDLVTDTKIIITHTQPAHSSTSFFATHNGKQGWHNTKTITTTFEGNAETMAVLVEYLYWFLPHNDKIRHGVLAITYAGMLMNPIRSHLPQFVLFRAVSNHHATEADKRCMEHYGLNLDAFHFFQMKRAPGWWIHVATANDLWVECGTGTFADFLREFNLPPSTSATPINLP